MKEIQKRECQRAAFVAMKADRRFLNAMGRRSMTLRQILCAAGFVKGNGVATAGIRLVSRLAKEHGLRDWPKTRTIKDYDALIKVTREALKK
jgi:hypothetical protein